MTIFDATSAYAHAENSRKLIQAGVMVIDLTPAAIGPYCVPPVNLTAHHVGKRSMNVNMVTMALTRPTRLHSVMMRARRWQCTAEQGEFGSR